MDWTLLLAAIGAVSGIIGAFTGIFGAHEGRRANLEAERRLAESDREERRKVIRTLLSDIRVSRALDPDQEVHPDSGTGAWGRAAVSIRRVRKAVASAGPNIGERSNLHPTLEDFRSKLEAWLTLHDTADEPIPTPAQVEEQSGELRRLQSTRRYVVAQLSDALDADTI